MCRSPGSGIGSSHGRLRSYAIPCNLASSRVISGDLGPVEVLGATAGGACAKSSEHRVSTEEYEGSVETAATAFTSSCFSAYSQLTSSYALMRMSNQPAPA